MMRQNGLKRCLHDVLPLPTEIIDYVSNGFLIYKPVNNIDFREAIDLWITNRTEAINKYGHISLWNTVNVTSMNNLFSRYDRHHFNDDISDWDVSHVTTMDSMFSFAEKFNQDISRWDVRSVTSMAHMFSFSKKFNQDISKWNVSSVKQMQSMFEGSFFNNDRKPLVWGEKVSNVVDMRYMFSNSKKFNQDISNWDVSSVQDMHSMFFKAEKFNNNVKPLLWKEKVRNVIDMSHMFAYTHVFNQDISNWNVESVLYMSYMFAKANSFNNGNKPLTWGDSIENVKIIKYMFYYAKEFNQDISCWNIKNVINAKYMFFNSSFNNGGKPLRWKEKLSRIVWKTGMFKNLPSAIVIY